VVILTNSFDKSEYKRRTVERSFSLGPTATKFITIILVAVAALFYLVQQTQSATKNYQVQDKKDAKQQLLQDSERLKVEATRLQSLGNITQDTEKLNLVPTSNVNYLDK